MTSKKLSATAQQMLSLLLELPHGTGYPLSQIGAHVGTASPEEFKDSVEQLESQGYIKSIQTEGFSEPVAFLLSATGRGDIDDSPEEEDSIISNFNVGFFKTGASETPANAATSEHRTDRGIITTKVDFGAEEPAAAVSVSHRQYNAPSTALETVTIKQILESLSSSIENSDAISAQDKWPLVEKINALTSHPLLRATLATPLKSIVK